MSEEIKPKFDDIETSLLYLFGDTCNDFDTKIYRGVSKIAELESVSAASDYNKFIPNRFINCPWIYGWNTTEKEENERWLTTDTDVMMLRPEVILNNDILETALFDPNKKELKWTMYKKINLPKRYFHFAGANSIIFEAHYRKIGCNLQDEYIKLMGAYSQKTNLVRHVHYDGGFLRSRTPKDVEDFQNSFLFAASIYDDAHSIKMWQVEIGYKKSFKIAVYESAAKELFSIREAPLTGNNRKKPLLHWVNKHFRTKPVNEGYVEIPKHLRGITEFDIDEYKIKIISPEKREIRK